jgi:hypothetical protein
MQHTMRRPGCGVVTPLQGTQSGTRPRNPVCAQTVLQRIAPRLLAFAGKIATRAGAALAAIARTIKRRQASRSDRRLETIPRSSLSRAPPARDESQSSRDCPAVPSPPDRADKDIEMLLAQVHISVGPVITMGYRMLRLHAHGGPRVGLHGWMKRAGGVTVFNAPPGP